MKISVVITTKDEAKNISDLLDSLVVQEPPFEVVIVDSDSKDATCEVVNDFAKRYENVKLYNKPGTRPYSMNYGVSVAEGAAIAFLGADCVADRYWIKELRKALKDTDILMGKIIDIGASKFKELDRVELYHKGYEVTYPGCNTTYKKEILEKLGGFDARFVTAEDIDLNYRAVNAGYKIKHAEDAIIYHKTKASFRSFLKQAFWNGYGRKQLTLKHGRLWAEYKPLQMLKQNMSFWYMCRLVMGLLGYLACKLFREKR